MHSCATHTVPNAMSIKYLLEKYVGMAPEQIIAARKLLSMVCVRRIGACIPWFYSTVHGKVFGTPYYMFEHRDQSRALKCKKSRHQLTVPVKCITDMAVLDRKWEDIMPMAELDHALAQLKIKMREHSQKFDVEDKEILQNAY